MASDSDVYAQMSTLNPILQWMPIFNTRKASEEGLSGCRLSLQGRGSQGPLQVIPGG